MAKTVFTLRMGSEERDALKNLSRIVKRPMNQLIVEAVKRYVHEQGEQEKSLEASLASLRAYRKKDPAFKRAAAAFVDSEASVKDPLEGEPFEESADADPLKPAASIQNKVREILGA